MTTSLTRPPALRPGDRVAVVCSSSPVPEARLERGCEVLRARGLEPVVLPSARTAGTLRPYLAGDDALRAADLTTALTDPSFAGVILARGGSGAQRTLAAMDWDAVRAARPAPRVLTGFSDVTALHEAVATQLGWASVHSSTMAHPDEPGTTESVESLLTLVMNPETVTEFDFGAATTIVPGSASGVTVGGNLCLLAASLGTPTSRPAGGGILLLEDVTEEDFRIDRMLTQLLRAGFLDGVAAILTGTWAECGPLETVHDILRERLAPLGVPMISGVDIGHGPAPQRAFPLGVAATLDAAARRLTLHEPALVPAAS